MLRELDSALTEVKSKHGVPRDVELKWSPAKDHFLRTSYSGVREDLYRDVLRTLAQLDARVLCAVHGLDECYGVRHHGWSDEHASLWAAKQQLSFLAERFETNDLLVHDDHGLIISDRYGNRDGEEDLIKNFSFAMIIGTSYNEFDRIALAPLMADSHLSNLIQAADIVTGVIVSALGGGKHGTALLEDVASMFVYDPHHGSSAFASMFSPAVLGYGLKLFPSELEPEGLWSLKELDKKYVVTEEGVRRRERKRGSS